jgi:hypothetical protein
MTTHDADRKLIALWLQVLLSATIIYALLWNFIGPDLKTFVFPWVDQIRAEGFSKPVGNYTPPYLYLLALGSVLPVSDLAIVKTVSILGIGLLALSVVKALRSFGVSTEGAAFIPILPSVLFNGPFLGQCDAFWVACCVMAVASRRNVYAMAAWAGLGLAFKMQAVFVAPFALAGIARRHAWAALAIPPAIYLLAIAPAWLAGWPIDDLLTIYLRQYEFFDRLSTAPNLWAFPALFWQHPSATALLLPYSLTVLATAVYWFRFPSEPLRAALLSALIVPFFLPKMHERYFLLADVLALCFSLRERKVAIFLLVQLGSILSLANYAIRMPLILNALGSIPMGTALYLLARPSGGKNTSRPASDADRSRSRGSKEAGTAPTAPC